MVSSSKIFKIKGVVKHYDWGGKTFLPTLLNIPNPEKKPFAEYWLGTEATPNAEQLPYLLKVLDVEKMLSIQVHPTKQVAARKFREENEKGIPLDASYRNYKDENHKPELLSPLSDFYLLHGFKEPAVLKKILSSVPELDFLSKEFDDENYQRVYTTVMRMPQADVNARLEPLLRRIVPMYQAGQLEKGSEDFWAARAALSFNTNGNADRGIFSIYLFNLVHMRAGDALFQDAGLPHAYLEGYTMEIMSNSDNVLRGGLTPKHIDVDELLEHVRYEPTVPRVMAGSAVGTLEESFITPATDFQLSKIGIRRAEGIAIPAQKTDIYFVYEGEVEASADEQKEHFASGDAFLAVAGTVVHLGAITDAVVFRATEPVRGVVD